MYLGNERTVIICGDQKFPHGDAGGNRMEYMAKCLIEEGFEPYIVSLGKNFSEDYDEEEGCYLRDSIRYFNCVLSKGKKGKFERYFSSGKSAAKILNRLSLKPGTPVVLYTSNPIFANQARKGINNHKKHRFFYDIVEWVDESSFPHGKLNPRYWIFKRCFNKVYPSGDGVIAISKNIQNHFASLNVPTHLYPICLDYTTFSRPDGRTYDGKVRFIYPGVPGNKEATDVMLEALASLEPYELEKIEFHYTAVKEARIRAILGERSVLLDKLGDKVTFHSWMEYEDLLKLYWSMDALLMVRKNNLITKSNFPSKVPELMACGVTVLANEQGDFFEYLTDGVDSVKIEEISVESCAVAIRKLLNMDAESRRRLSENAVRCASEKFDYRRYSKPLCAFLKGE